MSKIIFIYDTIPTIVQCSKEDKMRDICLKYSSEIDIDINLLYFLYGGSKIDLNLTFDQLANSLDKYEQEMVVLVYLLENEGFICPKCGENIELDSKIIEKICSSNNIIYDNLYEIKEKLDNIINYIINKKEINSIKTQLENIRLKINISIEEIKKNNEKINKLKDMNQINESTKSNIIEGVLKIKVKGINKGVVLFNKRKKDEIEVYLNDTKVNMINEENQWKIDYNFKEDGKYKFKIVFNNNITSFYRFFENCSNLYSIDFSNFDSINVTDMSYMFNNCYQLKEIKGLDKFNTSDVNNMTSMFQFCENLKILDLSNFDTSLVRDMSYMFNKCYELKEIKGINKFNTSKVTDMSSMFKECEELKYLDLSNFETQFVKDMNYMFCNCKKLKEIKGINKFKTNKVNFMSSMFNNCNKLEYLDLSSFDTSKIYDMSFMFNECHKLKEIKGINKFNTIKVQNMKAMFQSCYKLEHLDLSNFNTSNTGDMSFMFYNCESLKYLNISNFEHKDISQHMFAHVKNDECELVTKNKILINLFYSSVQ